ncbi:MULTISPECIES: tetratricopeptide repeat protein [unclassified Pseudoalteromonas]|uniref:tetratricopeptide repeat protein n=1 Tax=unclassified Pseudoalteromonas TaxID=194690 RepID=UPI001F33EBF9|nr:MULTISPECIES: tetratricopeptide repeat protein [unclassified Pseudoalteromonas]MCF2828113.1 tetratricopeptide repeat protein [Pseudoalteromonas sp. OF5H-5]MCF2831724.1 tetratricopeptide repeat protein [Pseudoalteromonas sp. DL2-H6]MCF2924104.1 tetratricopeptide repeat protein [Pseudoalteromonas sp. DL2-H1]
MKLIINAIDDTTLSLLVDDVLDPLTRHLTLRPEDSTLLNTLCDSYQRAAHSLDSMSLLRSIGNQLFELLNQHPDVIQKWLHSAGGRQLEIQTTAAAGSLQPLLLNLPWEVLVYEDQFLAADTTLYEVLRRVGQPTQTAPTARYKDLTLAFMAADPDFASELHYEAEERAILLATRKAKNLNLWVEESGNLDSLTQRIAEAGHCDMIHLSCHGGFDDTRKQFALQLEDDHYGACHTTASDFQGLSAHIQGVFLSACQSAKSSDTASFALALVKMGIANVVGWDGSVRDDDATAFSAHLYQALLQQLSLPQACAIARHKLLLEHLQGNDSPHWHLGRVYLSGNGGWPLIDGTQAASPKRRGKHCYDVLDRKKHLVPVASKETFVGRRVQTKQALNALADTHKAGVLLTGIGGTGKSSLAARIVHRMEPQYKAVIIYQDYSEVAILSELKQFVTGPERHTAFQRYLNDIKQNPGFFTDNLVEILEQHLAEQPVIVVVDDLEQHVLEPLSSDTGAQKPNVKPRYLNVLRGVVNAFAQADTHSHLLMTSRYAFSLADEYGGDLSDLLHQIDVPDMNALEQEKHWLALLQIGVSQGERDKARDYQLLARIWQICQGNPGLQDLLYQPLLKGEYAILEQAIARLANYHAAMPCADFNDDVDKYLQRIALTAYFDALTDTEQAGLNVLSLFDFPVPEHMFIQAGPLLGIDAPERVLQKLSNLGLLVHWQGEGLDQHISCYGLARKILPPLSQQDKNHIAQICANQLWHTWFSDFLHQYKVPPQDSLHASIYYILIHHFPSRYQGEMPLQSALAQSRIAHLQRLCLKNCLADWGSLDFSAGELLDLLELSMSLNTFEKLRVAAHAIFNLSITQLKDLNHVFVEERDQFKELAKEFPQDIIHLLLTQFGTRTELLKTGYETYFGSLSDDFKKVFDTLNINNEEERYIAQLRLAKTPAEQAETCSKYALFLADQKQDYEQAETFYQRTIKTDPENAGHLGNYANFLAYQKQDYEQAETFYRRAIKADPKHANHLGNYAYFLANQKQDYEQAETFYQRAIEADPKHVNHLGNYAIFLADQKQDYEQAETFYQRAIEADPEHANNLGNYAVFLTDQKQDYEQAETFYQRAIEAYPKHADNLGSYARFLASRKQDYEQAEIFYRRAIEADPEHVNHLGNYAIFLANQKQDYEQAETFYRRAIEADPKHANNLGNYARFLASRKQDYKQAETFYQRAIKAGPEHAGHLGNYALFLAYQKQDYEQAETFYQRAIKADPKHANHLGNYAYFLANYKQDYEQAETFYRRAIEADPKHVNHLGNYAIFLADQKQDYEQAETFYQRAIEADPEHASNLGNYAVFLTDQKQDCEQAETFYQRAIKADPKHANCLSNYANLLQHIRQDYQQAEEFHLRALELEPTDANFLSNYAQLLFITQGAECALPYLEQAESQPDLSLPLQLEMAFYRYAHCPPYELAPLKRLLLSTVRVPGWWLLPNVERAQADGHPHSDLLHQLALVAMDTQTIDILDSYPTWKETQ